MDERALVAACIEARKAAYVPYSHFAVGAALLCKDGQVVLGCNIENAAYTPSNCAERTAMFKAVSEGQREFEAIAICGGPADNDISEYCPPCGVCRQVLREFVNPRTFKLLLAKSSSEWRTYTLDELLPESFGPEDLQHKH